MVGFLMVAFLGLAIAALAGLGPLVALRSLEEGARTDATVALAASLAAWSAVLMFGPAWATVMLTAVR